MSERSAMSVFDVVAVDHLTSLQKNTDRNSAPKQLRDHRRRHGTSSPSLSYTKSLPATPKISRKSSPDTLRKSMARHQESLSRAGSPFGSSTRLVPPSPYHGPSDLGLITSSTGSNDNIMRSSNRSNDDISRLSKRSNDDVSRLASRNNDDILRSSDRNNDDIPITSSRYQRINKQFERTRFSNQRGPTPFLDRQTSSSNTSRDASPSRNTNRSSVPPKPYTSRSSTDGVCSRAPGLYQRATLEPDKRQFQKPRSSKTAFGHSPLGSKEDNRYKTPYSSDENVDLISTNYPYTSSYASSHTVPRNYRLNSIAGPSCESREVLLGRYPGISSSRGSTPAQTPRDLSPLRSHRGFTPMSSVSARSSRHTSPVRSSRGVTPLNSICARTSRHTSPVRLSRGVTPLSSRGATPASSTRSSRQTSPVRSSARSVSDVSPSSSIKSSRKSSLANSPVSNTRSSPVTSLLSDRKLSPTSSSVSINRSSPDTSIRSNRNSSPTSSTVTSPRSSRKSSPTSCTSSKTITPPLASLESNRISSPTSCSAPNMMSAPVKSLESDRYVSPSNSQTSEKAISSTNLLISTRRTSPTLSNQRASPTNSVVSGRNISPEMQSLHDSTSSKSNQRSSPVTEPITTTKYIESLSPRSSRKTSPIMLRPATTSYQRISPTREPILDYHSQKSSRQTSPVREPVPASYSRKSSRRTSPVNLKSTKSSRRTSPVREPILVSSSQRSSRRTSPVTLRSSKSSRRTSPVREQITSPIWINSSSRASSRRQSPDSSQHLQQTTSNRDYSPVSVRSSRRTSPVSVRSSRRTSPVSVRSSRRTSPVRPNKKAYPTVTRELAANSKIPRISSEFIDKLSKDVADELEDTLSLTGSISLMDTHKSVHSDSGIGEELVLSGDEKPVKKYDFASVDRSQLEKLLKSVTDKKQEDADKGEDNDLHLESSPSTEVAPDLVRRQSVIIQGLVMETEELREKVATLEDELATVPYVEEMQEKLGAFERKLEDSESYVYQLLEENIDMKTEMETLEIEINEAQDHFRDNDAREFKKTKWELETMSKSVRNLQLKLKKAQLKAALLRQEKEELEEKQKEAAMWRGAVVVGAVLAATFWKLKS